MRKMAAIAKRYIAPSTGKMQTMKTDAEVKDIIAVIMQADQRSKAFTDKFAPFLRGPSDRQTLKNIWSFVRRYIRYEKDKAGHEVVKSPGRTWEDRSGDCKSMSVMVGSLAKNLGYKYFYRVAFYDKDNPEQGHIYPIVELPSGKVVVDAVHHTFDEEVPFWKAQDYDPQTGKVIAREAKAIGGTRTNMAWVAPVGILAFGAAYLYWNAKSVKDD